MTASFFPSLRFRLLVLIIIAVIPALAYIFYTAYEQRSNIEAETRADTMRIAKLAADDVGQLIQASRQILLGLSEVPAVQNKDVATCNDYFSSFKKNLPMYVNIAAVKPNGDVFCSAIPLHQKINISDRPYFQTALHKKIFTLGEFQISRITHNPDLNTAMPVRNGRQQIIAVVYASINLNWFKDQLSNIKIDQHAILTVLDRKCTILYRYPRTEISAGENLSGTELTKAIADQEEGTISAKSSLDGITRIWAFTQVPGTDYGISVRYGISREAVFADINRLLIKNLMVLLTITCMAFAVAWYGGNFFVMRRMRMLIKATDGLAKGDLSVRVDTENERDEIGQLGNSFNKMAESLERYLEERKESEEQYRRLFEESKDAIYVNTPEGKYLDVNSAFVELFGYTSKEEMFTLDIGTDIYVDPEDRKTFSQMMKEKGFVKDLEQHLKRKDGKRLTVLTTSTAVRNKQGDIVAYRGINHDITERRIAEETLRAKTEELDRYFTHALDLLCIADTDGYFRRLNKEWEAVLGYSLSELEGTRFLDYVHPDDHDATVSTLARLGGQEEVLNFVNRYRVKDGSYRWIEWRSFPEGRLVYASARDITERKAHEAEIERLNRLYAALSQVNQAIVRVHSREELCRDVCRALVEFGGFKMVWMGWHDAETHQVTLVAKHGDETGYMNGVRVFADNRPEGYGATGTAIREGRPYICNDYLKDPNTLPWHEVAAQASWRSVAAFPIRIADNVWGAISVCAHEINYFGDREVALLEEVAMTVSFGLDTLEREAQKQQAEERVRESALRLEMAARAGSVGLWDWDLRTNKVFYSLEWKRQIGYEDSEISNDVTEWQNRIHPDDHEHSIPSIQSFNEKPNSDYHTEFRLRHKDGSYRWIFAQASLLNDDQGRPIRMLGSHVDITERRTLEDQLRQAQKMEAVGQLGGGVAHDFNNILSAIVGYSHLSLMKMSPDDPNRHNIEQILASSERATELTQRLLTFSRKQPVNLVRVDLNDIIAKFEKLLLQLLREDIEFKTTLTNRELPVRADRGQMEQVLMNLVSNSRDAMPHGGRIMIKTGLVKLDQSFIEAHGFGREGDYAMLSVTDTGIGIPETIKDKIFEPFFTTKDEGKGTGLGLSMVYGIVKKHEGYINVYSQPEIGTTFNIYLPVARVTTEAEQQKTDKEVPLRGGTETVLIAEDDADVRLLTANLLRHYGYTVIETVDGLDAVAKFTTNRDRIHLVILDGIMPKMNGKEAWTKIKSLSPGVKAIFISGYADDIFTKDGIPDGEASFIPKPSPPLVLIRRVREVLDE